MLLKKIRIDRRSAYTFVDVFLALRLLEKEPLGRFSFMKRVGLGEATAKTLMKRLTAEGLARTTTKGQVLTAKGEKTVNIIGRRISQPVEMNIESLDKQQSIVLVVKQSAKKVKMGIEQRDEGMKFGARVATLVFSGGRLLMPGCDGYEMEGLEKICRLFSLREKDTVIISSGKKGSRERGAVAAALTLVDV